MTLYLDNFSITGNTDEIIDFLKKYNTVTYVSGGVSSIGNIGDLELNMPVNDVMTAEYQGHPINSMSDSELREAIRITISGIDKVCNLYDFNHNELVSLLTTYASKYCRNL